MVYLNFAVAGVVLGLLLGGSLGALGGLAVCRLWLAYAAVLLQVVAFPSGVFPWSTPEAVAKALWLASYALLLALVAFNRRYASFLVVGAGIACNLAAILSNRGLMPATRDALSAAGVSYDVRNNSVASVHPHLAWLVDRFAWPDWLPLANVFSVGDVMIGLGLLMLVVGGMRPRVLVRVRALATRM